MKKSLKVLLGIIAVPYLIVVIFLTICLLNYNDYNITVINNRTFIIVEDDGLEPDFAEGDLVIVKKNANKNIAVNDKIFFYDTYRRQVSVNLAPIIDKEDVTASEATYTIEGDYKISSEFVIGKADTSKVYKGMGSVLKVLESRWGYLLIVILPILFVFLFEIYSIIAEVKKPAEDE